MVSASPAEKARRTNELATVSASGSSGAVATQSPRFLLARASSKLNSSTNRSSAPLASVEDQSSCSLLLAKTRNCSISQSTWASTLAAPDRTSGIELRERLLVKKFRLLSRLIQSCSTARPRNISAGPVLQHIRDIRPEVGQVVAAVVVVGLEHGERVQQRRRSIAGTDSTFAKCLRTTRHQLSRLPPIPIP